MTKIYVDDIREPVASGFIRFFTTNDTLGFIRRMYKAGNYEFYLDLDNDAGDYNAPSNGGDYINILKTLEDMRGCGHIRNMLLQIHIHSMNPVAVQNMRAIINHNKNWMSEV